MCLDSSSTFFFRYSARSHHRAIKPSSRSWLRVGEVSPKYLPTCTNVTAKKRTDVLGCAGRAPRAVRRARGAHSAVPRCCSGLRGGECAEGHRGTEPPVSSSPMSAIVKQLRFALGCCLHNTQLAWLLRGSGVVTDQRVCVCGVGRVMRADRGSHQHAGSASPPNRESREGGTRVRCRATAGWPVTQCTCSGCRLARASHRRAARGAREDRREGSGRNNGWSEAA